MSDDPTLSALARLETVQTGQIAMQADITGLKAGQTSLRVDLMARMERRQNPIQAIQDDIQANFARADKAVDQADGVLDALRAQHDVIRSQGREISAMERQILRIKSDVEELKKANEAKGA